MSFTALTDPFNIRVEKDGVEYVANITYGRLNDCGSSLFEVSLVKPEGVPPFLLKEKPTLNPEYDYMVWVDDLNKVNVLYQLIGAEIEKYMRKTLGIFLIDAPLTHETKITENSDKDS
jgi:hypothetical protein